MKTHGFWYLATPYSKFAGGLDAAFDLACHASARLIAAGLPVFSPIAHSHHIARAGRLDPLDHKLWLALDLPMIRAAMGLIVIEAAGWRDSVGMAFEIDAFRRRAKAIRRISWPFGDEIELRAEIEAAPAVHRESVRRPPAQDFAAVARRAEAFRAEIGAPSARCASEPSGHELVDGLASEDLAPEDGGVLAAMADCAPVALPASLLGRMEPAAVSGMRAANVVDFDAARDIPVFLRRSQEGAP